MGKSVLLLIITLAVTSLIMVESAFAQSAPKPSVPEVIVKIVDHSYDVPLTYINYTNPYTGQQEIRASGGYHVENKTIDVIIKNQPFTPTNINGNTTQLFYVIRWKGHFEKWNESYDLNALDYYYYINNYGVPASDSEYTVKSYSLSAFGNVPVGGQIDFQVKAQVGYSYRYFGGHILPIGTNFQLVTESDWSSTQTITIGESQMPTPSPATTPTPTAPNMGPTSPPSQEPLLTPEHLELMVGVTTAVAVLGAGLGLFIYLAKRK